MDGVDHTDHSRFRRIPLKSDQITGTEAPLASLAALDGGRAEFTGWRRNFFAVYNALPTVAVLRLVLWMPQALHWFFGVSQVGFWTHFWGSLLGYVPPLLLVSLLGGELFDASGQLQASAWPAMAGLLGLSAVATLLARWHYRRRAVGR